MAKHEAMYTGAKNLFDHPVVDANRGFIEAKNRQGDDNGGCSMPARGGTTLDQSEHELTQTIRIKWAVFHLVLDEVVVCLG